MFAKQSLQLQVQVESGASSSEPGAANLELAGSSSFRNYICDDPIIGSYDVPALFDFLAEEIKKTMRENLGTKVYLNLKARMRKLNDGKQETHTFYSGEFKILRGATPGDIEEVIQRMEAKISELLEKMEMVGSGWAFLRNEDLKLRFAEFKPMGSSYLEIPEWIKNKKAVINILNTTDNECFKWCVTRLMHPIGNHPERVTKKLCNQSELFDWTGVSFPTTFEDVGRFEANNNISVKVLGCDEETKEIIHLRNGNGRYKHAVTLLLFEGHYCLVRNVSRLASRQSRDGITYFCDYCSFSNQVKTKVVEHQESCTREVFEPERLFERCVESPFVIYADFDSCLEPTYEDRGERTTLENQHIPIGYSYYLVSRVDPQDNKLERQGSTAKTLRFTSYDHCETRCLISL